MHQVRNDLAENGFIILPNSIDDSTLASSADAIEQVSITNTNFRRTNDLFAIRNLLQEVPELDKLLWHAPFNRLLDQVVGYGTDCVKAIYFDKPAGSNWVVPWHQDLQISVDRQESVARWTNWNRRHGQWRVQPSTYYLNYLTTVRIHLDECDETNGALKVIPGSHKRGILTDADLQSLDKTQAVTCCVPKGGLLIMKPLLVHASGKSTGSGNRRVIHLELTDRSLPKGLQWREYSRRWTKLEQARDLASRHPLPEKFTC